MSLGQAVYSFFLPFFFGVTDQFVIYYYWRGGGGGGVDGQYALLACLHARFENCQFSFFFSLFFE